MNKAVVLVAVMAGSLSAANPCWSAEKAPSTGSPSALANREHETLMRQAMQQALWPADIVRLSRDYLQDYPAGEWADAARALNARALGPMRMLNRQDVWLYRGAFQVPSAESPAIDDIRQAALGDRNAALRMAHRHRRVDGGGAGIDLGRYVGWLQYAAELGHEAASYELALHFRRQDQPALASRYEARALALGFSPPRALEHTRK